MLKGCKKDFCAIARHLFGAAVAEQSFLGHVQLVNLGRHLRQQLLGLLEERQLGGNHICQVAKRFRLKMAKKENNSQYSDHHDTPQKPDVEKKNPPLYRDLQSPELSS